ncbi:aspartyl/asparaginyl beta-hydroxylase domain-containing protein [Chiayiivirga flava]|uniref:Aspartate beta-hydroxylase n=1 Tax=Chiayiivirga flava TaxID=659595 RepID=A0A7W8D6J4_9GAMM|nr:aspartyl/asparaginyl beta-hydroxylase domain-containing protein [Chiayiivirga flava]MBB5208849.1 aspartate beta-hydroxylase [Chiayiivirga flava]
MPTPPSLVSLDIDAQLRQANLLLQRGDSAGATRLLRGVLDHDAANVPALNLLARLALGSGRAWDAVQILRRGVQANPRHPVLQHNLALALAQNNKMDHAIEALRTAVALKPDYLSAWLYLGGYLQKQRQEAAACGAFMRALSVGAALSRHGAPELQQPEIRQMVQHAQAAVQQIRSDVFERALAPVRARVGREALARIQGAVDIYLQRRPANYPPKQRPAGMFIPDLPPRPFFEREDLPWVETLEAGIPVIREELLALMQTDNPFTPYVQLPPDSPQARDWAIVNHSDTWASRHVYRHGELIESTAALCPRTVALLDTVPVMRIPGHAPEVLFSVLKARSRIPAHHGTVNGRLIIHVPLIVPFNCGALKAADEQRTWEEGKCIIFDDSFAHEAWNDSDHTRVVLLVDTWNPYLSEAEREAFSAALVAIDDFTMQALGEHANAFV